MEALILEFASIFRRIVVVDFLRYFIPASGAFFVFWILFGKALRHRFIQKKKPESNRLWFEFTYSMSTIVIFALVGVGIHYTNKTGVFTIYRDVAQYGWTYLVATPILMLLIHDTYFYWTHRWMHHPKIYRHVHKIHHKSTNPSPWAAYSFHPLEAVVQAGVLPLILLLMPVHTFNLFLFLTYMILRNVLGHLGFELFPKGFIKNPWVNWNTSSTHHNMHHHHFHCNYGLYFTWWDKWMKTDHQLYEETFEEVTSRKREANTRQKLSA
ncbi:sterol desaturase family protein [Marinoscillum furvescens]|uniref:C-5 sterol desaturase n=1 Tax=Marinoscillum furvescens DSM 4134 TaxID=1122208 RepID=A0A3D9LIJ1_MARFU|nr:sterol desaturase family protein [Marinoscillum furvescens]REE05675.1 C-5 sterol desaturase [Marinoscillum furvescens DSM 4134]